MRYAARRDMNESEIVRALRSVGACVEIISAADLPDLLCCLRGRTVLLEIKSPERRGKKRQLRPGQEAFRVRWVAAGGNHDRVETVDEALRAVGFRGVD